MTSQINSPDQVLSRDYWIQGLPGQIAKGLCGIIAVLVALKAAAYQPTEPELFAHQGHFFRILAFAALTVWTAFAIGVQRRGQLSSVV